MLLLLLLLRWRRACHQSLAVA
eukprot:COSAG05_NODE_22239_length_266_cov_0.616766_1_plen_21_part_01